MIGYQTIGTQMNLTEENLKSLQVRFLVGAINRMTLRSLEEHFVATKAPVSHLQFGMMMTIRHQEQTSSELSRMFGLDPSTLVPMVDSLVKKGYLQRGVDPNDRRRNPLSITPEGHRIISEIMNQFSLQPNDVLAKSLSGMGDEKVQQLTALLHEVIEGLPDGEATLKGMQERLDAYQRAGSAHTTCQRGDTSPDAT
jgi:DNA-binding MarR family transcriptional regulator